jgi:hypothetical protein
MISRSVFVSLIRISWRLGRKSNYIGKGHFFKTPRLPNSGFPWRQRHRGQFRVRCDVPFNLLKLRTKVQYFLVLQSAGSGLPALESGGVEYACPALLNS